MNNARHEPLRGGMKPLRRIAAVGTALTTAVVLLFAGSAGALATDGSDEPGIEPGQEFASERVIVNEGHLDFGPTLGTGEWQLNIHDDSGPVSVWRDLSDVVIEVSEAARQVIPDDATFSFLGEKAGSEVYVIPQTQREGVVWLGWNTQEPSVTEEVARGVNLKLLDVAGPGDMTVFQVSGNFSTPEVLWTSREASPQQAWLELGAHTHANWVFSEAGEYLVRFEAEAERTSGEALRAEGVLRFAVGDGADSEALFAATADATPGADPAESQPAATSRAGYAWALIGGSVVVIALIVLVTWRQAKSIRAGRHGDEAAGVGR
ncbi:choice-of-anchor M domain-containing protein [Leucobacter chinensis]|uniref:choice-of-anchor M domain-containing protein n=1 Tax=Leucobacter chinensis TaxID=2851010 RepID=UPI001C246681|nr:choice-of-anchor M domain-containing protein [Leucobacter chinensis]